MVQHHYDAAMHVQACRYVVDVLVPNAAKRDKRSILL